MFGPFPPVSRIKPEERKGSILEVVLAANAPIHAKQLLSNGREDLGSNLLQSLLCTVFLPEEGSAGGRRSISVLVCSNQFPHDR